MFNIVGNAIKFTSRGYVKLSYAVTEESNDVVRIRFEVEDTGVGIREEVREKNL